MLRRYTQPHEPVGMLRRTVTFIARQVVAGVSLGQRHDLPIAPHLRHDAGRTDRQIAPIALHHRSLRDRQLRDRPVAIHRTEVGRRIELRDRSTHRQERRLQNIDPIDFRHRRRADTDRQRNCFDRFGKAFAPFGAQRFAIRDAELTQPCHTSTIENHCRRCDRPEQRPATDFIDPGDPQNAARYRCRGRCRSRSR